MGKLVFLPYAVHAPGGTITARPARISGGQRPSRSSSGLLAVTHSRSNVEATSVGFLPLYPTRFRITQSV